MKTILSSRRHHYVARVSIFLLTLALVVGMIGCDGGGGGVEYNLTMAANPVGGGTATDLTNASPYAAGTVVSIKAVAAAGYQFVNWSAPAGTFGNANTAETTFTMPAQDVTVTANFELSEFYGGHGTEGNPYQIANWNHLDNVRNYLDSYFILVEDLDSTTVGYEELASATANEGKGWQPFGSIEDINAGEFVDPFTGTFDGQEYEIRDLFVNRPDEDGVGLFGIVEEAGVIENVGVVSADVTGWVCVGGLVGGNLGHVSNSYSTGSVAGYTQLGGLVGRNDKGTVSDCYSTGDVTGNSFAGGLVGGNRATVSNSHADGDVTVYRFGGGLVGYSNSGSINDCYSTGDVTGEDNNVGGLVGMDSWSSIINSYATGIVDGYMYVGGLIGYSRYGTVSDCYSTGSVNGEGSVGGLIGVAGYGTVSNSYSIGNVTGNDDVGGLIGMSEVNMDNCHATGSVDGDERVGGLLGSNFVTTVSNSHATGDVNGNVEIGGLVGRNANAGIVSDSYSTGNVTGGSLVGSLVGRNYYSTVSDSYSIGSVIGTTQVGGLVGRNFHGTVSNSYAAGSVNGEGSVGGLVGYNDVANVSKSYSTGSVSGNSPVGGLVGNNNGGTVSNSFWDTQTSGQGSSDGGTPKTTTEMKNIATFLDAGWDIIMVVNPDTRITDFTWNIVHTVTYPFLSWQSVS